MNKIVEYICEVCRKPCKILFEETAPEEIPLMCPFLAESTPKWKMIKEEVENDE